jgi:hypothetical protein
VRNLRSYRGRAGGSADAAKQRYGRCPYRAPTVRTSCVHEGFLMPNGDGVSRRPSLVPGAGPARGARVAVLRPAARTPRGLTGVLGREAQDEVLNDLRSAAGQDITSSSWTRAAEAFSPVAGSLPAQGQHDDNDDDDENDGPDADIHGGFPLAGRLKTPMSCPWHGDPNRSVPPRCLTGAFPQVASGCKKLRTQVVGDRGPVTVSIHRVSLGLIPVLAAA